MLGKFILTVLGGAIGGALTKLYLEGKEPNFLRDNRVVKIEWVIHKLRLEQEAQLEIDLQHNKLNKEIEEDEWDRTFEAYDADKPSELIEKLEIKILQIYKFTKFSNSKWKIIDEARKDISFLCTLTLKDIDLLEAIASKYNITTNILTLRSYVNLMNKMALDSEIMGYDFENFQNIYQKAKDCLNDIVKLT